MSTRSASSKSRRGPRCVVGLAVGAAVAVLVAACGGGAPSSGPRTAASSRPVRDCLSTSQCYSPSQFRFAYGIQVLLDHGIDGRGQTVVLVEFAAPAGSAPRVTDIRQDLARFDSVFGLPTASLQVVNNLAGSPSPWLATSEEVEDTEIVHAVAPDARIRELLISDAGAESSANAGADVAAALRLGLTQGSVISFSHSWGEQCFTAAEVAQLNTALQAASTAEVTVVNSSGDIGASTNPCPGARIGLTGIKGVNLLDADPLVLAAGGTSLQADRATGAYMSETAWNTPPGPTAGGFSESSGGGFSQLFSRPAYQDDVSDIGAARGVPDVAADADPNTGLALALTDGGQNYIVIGAGGTSAAAPLWAAVITLADQYAGRHLGLVNPTLYRIGRSPADLSAFHDVTTGTNTVESTERSDTAPVQPGPQPTVPVATPQVPSPSQTVTGYNARPGWDPVTGWGSPDAEVLVPLLAR
jgi:subtilase family serine protease